MNCSDLDELLSAYANGELPRTQREFIEEHLSSCTNCNATLADYYEVCKSLISLKAMPSMPDISKNTMLKIRTGKSHPIKASERITIDNFISRQPKWKVLLVSTLALVLVVSLSIAIPSLFGQDSKVLATEIALNSPEVQTALGGRDTEELEVVDVIDTDLGYVVVVLQIENNLLIAANVDIETERVIQASLLELTDEKKQEVIDMARNDTRVKDLLDQGAFISDFKMGYLAESTTQKISPGSILLIPYEDSNLEVSVTFILAMGMKLGETEYIVGVDPIGGNVSAVINLTELNKQVEENMVIATTIVKDGKTITVITK